VAGSCEHCDEPWGSGAKELTASNFVCTMGKVN
jgi:hypothetical protein